MIFWGIMKSPLVSIVTPSYNQGQFIGNTIESVLRQSYPNIEYVVVDGASSDNTSEVLERYRGRINRIISEPDNGQSDAINKGFRLARGELVGWVNSDDILYPNCVEEIIRLYEGHPDGVIFYGAVVNFIDKCGVVLSKREQCVESKDHLLNHDYNLIQPGSFYRSEVVREVGYLNEEAVYCMDLDFWLKLLDYGSAYYVTNEPLAGFRIWEKSKTSTGGLKFLRNIRQVLESHNARAFSPNMRRLWWFSCKLVLEQVFSDALITAKPNSEKKRG